MMPLCEPVKLMAGAPRFWIAIESKAMDMRSPALSSMSSSRRGGLASTSRARAKSSSVVLPMALTTTTTSWPAARVATTFSATRWSFATSATLLPPYFCTTMLMAVV